jgi:toluene monooxygenase system protein E
VRRPPAPLRTYSHLAGAGVVPSEYQIVSSRLLYHPQKGFETNVPVGPWYQRHQRGGHLHCPDWEAFADPRATTYSLYTSLAARHEQHLNALAESADATAARGGAAPLAPDWRAVIEGLLPPLRYVWHGFQMIAAYVGQMAPASRIALVALFQAGDEMRRVHRIAQRMGQLRERWPDFGAAAMAQWLELPAWQPLRQVVEQALVAYDWGEAFVALCLTTKPFIDELLLGQFSGLARQRGDYLLAETLASLAEDGRWHRAWAGQLVTLLLRPSAGADFPASEAAPPSNRAALSAWLGLWLPRAQAAARASAALLGGEGPAAAARAEGDVMAWLGGLGLVAV